MDHPIDFAIVGGFITPGKIDIMGAGSPRNWDERMGYGWSGSFPVFTGLKLSKFQSRLRLYTTEDWNDWYAFSSVVEKPPYGKRPRAIDIVHPLLAMPQVDIRSVVVTNVSQAEPIDDLGTWAIVIDWLVFRKPKITLAKPEASEVRPKDEIEQQIEDRMKTFKDLLAE